MFTRVAELLAFRELFYVLVYRDVLARTKQSILGLLWVLIQPMLASGILSILLQIVLGVKAEGPIPYFVIIFCGMTLWQYFSAALTASTNGLIMHQDLLTQVYVPRAILVLYPVVSKLLDFAVAFVMLIGVLVIFGVPLQVTMIWIPLLLLPVMILISALGLLLAPMNVAFRDVGLILPFVLGLALYLVPILYPISRIPERWQALYSLNPIVPIIDGYQQVVLYGMAPNLVTLGISIALSLGLLILAFWFFGIFEDLLADVI